MDTDSKREEIKTKICDYLKQGMFKGDASRMSGISEDTYLRWYKEDTDFADRVEASILEYKQSLIKNLTQASITNPRIALEILRTRWAKEWEPSNLREAERAVRLSTWV
ncbi:MAG: hypothetical protein AAB778_00075 [Patescibacteria group bacterium]